MSFYFFIIFIIIFLLAFIYFFLLLYLLAFIYFIYFLLLVCVQLLSVHAARDTSHVIISHNCKLFVHYYSVISEDPFAQDLALQVGEMMKMPVPSSYNDITTSRNLRDHVGAVWYQRTFFVPSSWRDQRVFVRFGSVHYLAQVVSIHYSEFFLISK